MATGLHHATSLYLDAIGRGDYERAIETHAGARYTQHSHPVPDGKDGFKTFFAAFVEAHPQRDVRIVRSFQDGQYVFLHVLQVLDGGATRWVTMDLFDTDVDGRLVEHWDMIEAWTERTASARTMIDGPTEVADLHLTEANKNLVRRYVEDVLIGRHMNVTDYVSDGIHQHSPGLADGLAALVDGNWPRYLSVPLLVGQGNFVVVMAHAVRGGEDVALMDLFRVAEGRIVEHWGVVEPIVPREEWVNSGKF